MVYIILIIFYALRIKQIQEERMFFISMVFLLFMILVQVILNLCQNQDSLYVRMIENHGLES